MPLFNLPLEEVTADCQPAMALANDLNDYLTRHSGDPADQHMALSLLLGALIYRHADARQINGQLDLSYVQKSEKAIIQTFRTALVLSATANEPETRP